MGLPEALARASPGRVLSSQCKVTTLLSQGSRAVKTDRQQTDRKTERQKNRKTDRQKDRQTDRQTGRQTDRQADGVTDGATDRQGKTDRQTQKDRKTERQKDRRTKDGGWLFGPDRTPAEQTHPAPGGGPYTTHTGPARSQATGAPRNPAILATHT